MRNIELLLVFVVICLSSSCSTHNVHLANSEKLTNNECKTAIIFVHGFMGDNKSTWTNNDSASYWPELMANDDDFSNYDIYAINYYTELFGNRFTLKELGIWLNVELKNIGVIGNDKYENIIFIAHSMGNLVVRAAIFEDKNKYNDIKIPLILSLGAPSKGSDLATIGKTFFPDNQSFANLTSSENIYLNMLNEKWSKSQGDTVISCAYEKLSYGSFGLIVNENSATAICTGTRWPVASNHISMVKPRNSEDRIYIWAKNEIIEILNSPMLKNKINFRNLYSTSDQTLSEQKPIAAKNGKIPYENINGIKQSLTTMFSSDVDQFIISTIPKIQGGVTCDDLVEMLSHGFSSESATVVKKVAPYVRRPFTNNCFKKIGTVIFSSDASSAISSLISSEPRY
jgi:hypothetical protein